MNSAYQDSDPQISGAPKEGAGTFGHHFTAWLLNRIAARSNLRFKKSIARTGVSLSYWRIIGILRNNDGISLTDLCKLVIVDQPTLSRSVEQMASRGLVRRIPRADDARYLSLSLTEKGHEAFEAVWPIALRHNNHMLRNLTQEEHEELNRLLKKVLETTEDD